MPLCIIDDIQSQLQGEDFNARIKALLFWFLEMANHSLIKVMLLTSDRRIISVLENSKLFRYNLFHTEPPEVFRILIFNYHSIFGL